jgi:hypothetical protein
MILILMELRVRKLNKNVSKARQAQKPNYFYDDVMQVLFY